MKNVVAYVRCNSKHSEYRGLETQRYLIKKYSEENGINISAIYEDFSPSNNFEKRIGLIKMVDDFNSGLLDSIIVVDLDRLARSTCDLVKIKAELFQNKIDIICINSPSIDYLDFICSTHRIFCTKHDTNSIDS